MIRTLNAALPSETTRELNRNLKIGCFASGRMVGGTRRISSALLNDVRSIQISGNRNKSTSNVVRIYIRALLFFVVVISAPP